MELLNFFTASFVVFFALCIFIYEPKKVSVEDQEIFDKQWYIEDWLETEEEEEEEEQVLNSFDERWCLEKMTVAELRKVGKKEGIIWRNAHGKNKHLKKREIIEALLKKTE